MRRAASVLPSSDDTSQQAIVAARGLGPFLIMRGRLSKLAKQFPTEAAKFREAAMAEMLAEADGLSGKAKTDFISKQTSRIGKIEREIERNVPDTMKEFESAVRRLESGKATEKDEEFVSAMFAENSGGDVQAGEFKKSLVKLKAGTDGPDDERRIAQYSAWQLGMLRKKAINAQLSKMDKGDVALEVRERSTVVLQQAPRCRYAAGEVSTSRACSDGSCNQPSSARLPASHPNRGARATDRACGRARSQPPHRATRCRGAAEGDAGDRRP